MCAWMLFGSNWSQPVRFPPHNTESPIPAALVHFPMDDAAKLILGIACWSLLFAAVAFPLFAPDLIDKYVGRRHPWLGSLLLMALFGPLIWLMWSSGLRGWLPFAWLAVPIVSIGAALGLWLTKRN